MILVMTDEWKSRKMPLTYRTFIMGLESSRYLRRLQLPSAMPREWQTQASARQKQATRSAESRKKQERPLGWKTPLNGTTSGSERGRWHHRTSWPRSDGVGDQEGTIVGEQDVLDLLLGGLVHVCTAATK